MMNCIVNARSSRYLLKDLANVTEDYETNAFHYDYANNSLNCKLLRHNPYQDYFKQIYPTVIHENELTEDMLNVIHSYTDSQSNECYMKTNLNLLSANFEQIDWNYVNRLRCLIRGLVQNNLKHLYYRGLNLSDAEIQYYIDMKNQCYYTNSFTSFTIDRLLVYSGNAILMLKTDTCSEEAKQNLANIWKWSRFSHEKEALLAVGAKLRVAGVHYYGSKWEIDVELADE